MRRLNHGFIATCSALLVLGSAGAGAATSPAPGQPAVQPQALVVVDKGCENIIAPYTLTSSVKDLFKKSWRTAVDKARGIWQGGAQTVDPAAEVKDKTREALVQSNWLPKQTEELFGARAHAEQTNLLDRDSKIGKKAYPIADTLLAEALAKLTEGTEATELPYEFKIFILKNDTHNAMAQPGGYVYLDYGLLSNPKMLPKARFALAHEIAHVLQRHETRVLQGMIVDSFQNKDALRKAIEDAGKNPAGLLSNIQVGKDSYFRHHLDQELQADSCAARIVHRSYADLKTLSDSVDAFLADLDKAGKPAAAKPAPAAKPAAVPTVAAVNQNSAGQGQAAVPQNDAQKAAANAAVAATAVTVLTSGGPGHPTSAERAENLRKIQTEIKGAQSPAKTASAL